LGLAWGHFEHMVLLVALKSDRPLPISVSPRQRRVNHHSLPLPREPSLPSNQQTDENDIEDTLGLGPSQKGLRRIPRQYGKSIPRFHYI